MSPTRVDLTVLASDTVQDARVRTPDREVRLVALEDAERSAACVVVGEDGDYQGMVRVEEISERFR